MRYILSLGFMLLMASQSGAETYSWVDESGTYNFTEDLANVPARYRQKANRTEDVAKDPASQVSAPPEKKPAPAEAFAEKPSAAPVANERLYNGKTFDAWRQEKDIQEAELATLEQRLEQLNKEVRKTGLSVVQFTSLMKEYEDTRATYKEKYRVYNEFIESARKAGMTVNIRK